MRRIGALQILAHQQQALDQLRGSGVPQAEMEQLLRPGEEHVRRPPPLGGLDEVGELAASAKITLNVHMSMFSSESELSPVQSLEYSDVIRARSRKGYSGKTRVQETSIRLSAILRGGST